MTWNARDLFFKFLVQFLVLQLLTCPLILFFRMHDIPATGVGWIANLYFTLFTLSMYGLVVQKLAVSAGGNFIRLVMGGSGVKIVGSVLILTLVHVFFHPLNRSEVVLFLIIYALFTIFETYVLMKLSNQKL